MKPVAAGPCSSQAYMSSHSATDETDRPASFPATPAFLGDLHLESGLLL